MTTLFDRLHGLFIPHVTPFNDSGVLDLESLERLTTHFASIEGVTGYNNAIQLTQPMHMQDLKYFRNPIYSYGNWISSLRQHQTVYAPEAERSQGSN